MITFLFLLSLSAFGFSPDFEFGVANAPGQVEDKLEDTWLAWGRSGKIAGWKNNQNPEARLNFWSQPEIEIDLAQKLGAKTFRLGVDWARIMPKENVIDEKVIEGYRKILKLIREKKMKVMLTLMHHSVPGWFMEKGGWHIPENSEFFVRFSEKMINEFHDEVDTWITFNEANVFVVNSYTVGMWPPGQKSSPLSLFAFGPYTGTSIEALDHMAESHNKIYDWSHARYPHIKMGIAHNMARYKGRGIINGIAAKIADRMMNWRFPEKIRGKMDFFGFNYYGAEWISRKSVEFHPEYEYSESGRAIDVNGLYELLKEISDRFPKLPIVITENGIADREDGIRGAYIVEHLAAVEKAIAGGVPVKGYFVWTLTDNLEWSDGYCPQFGLVSVDRASGARKTRRSFDVVQSIFVSGKLSSYQRDAEWKRVLNLQGKMRPFCRAEDGMTALDIPVKKQYGSVDWRLKN